MANFMLSLKDTRRGRATEATRYPQRAGYVRAASWSGAVRVEVEKRGEEDWCSVRLEPHHGHGVHVTLYEGPMSGKGVEDYMKACWG